MSFNIQRITPLVKGAKSVIHQAEEHPTNDDVCITACGRWLDTDEYMVTIKPVTCQPCQWAISDNQKRLKASERLK